MQVLYQFVKLFYLLCLCKERTLYKEPYVKMKEMAHSTEGGAAQKVVIIPAQTILSILMSLSR